MLERGFSRGGWAGITTSPRRPTPVLDAIDEVPGLFVAAGFSGHGFKLCPAVGRMVAELVTTGRRAGGVEFRADRFRTGRPIRGRYDYSIVG